MRGNGSMRPSCVRSEGWILQEFADSIRSPSFPTDVNRILTWFVLARAATRSARSAALSSSASMGRREIGRFLDDARVPLDNNASERSLRRVALGRKNYLFVGDVEAGASIAGLYTLVATCEARGINPFAYLADIIPRVQDHPKRRLDELPGPWARARTDA